ncbi:hypothetical protein [Streptomyces sp. 150FB]|uniref:hypothetical protein n=1 Tax=Streptomyces sp. 150FB TaxID=1576605 RepID=UPI000698BFAC|nr:hypothetical protein [Streptomyces sp. 150FB]
MVRDEEFSSALRDFFHRALIASPEMTARVERHRKLLLEARASQQAGVPADSPGARDIAERVAADSGELVAALTGEHDADKARRSVAEFDRNGDAARCRDRAAGLRLLTRYHSLVATINGTPQPDLDRDRAAAVRAWMAAALRQGG